MIQAHSPKRLLCSRTSTTAQFDVQSKSVSATTAAPPPSFLMNLSREGGAEGSEAEREHMWKQVQSERRKFITLPRAWTKDKILSAFRSTKKVFSHTAELNSSHLLLTASADLLREEGEEP